MLDNEYENPYTVGMTKITTQYDEKTLIRKEEMELLWGPDHLPPQKLIDHWHNTLKTWLDEYCGGIRKPVIPSVQKKFDAEAFSIDEGEIVRLDIEDSDDEEKAVYVVALSKKTKTENGKKKTYWLCCPISNYSVPATMWEFYGSTMKEDSFVAQAWNIVPINEKDILKLARVPDAEVEKNCYYATKDTVKLILHQFERMANLQYQDLPMMEVGPRIFRNDDPRKQYQRDERNKFKVIIQADQPSKDEIQKVINEKAKEAVERQFRGLSNADSGKQETNNK